MQLLANYWWLLLIPVVAFFMAQSVRRTPRSTWVWVLRVAGGGLVIGALVWLVTGDIDKPGISLHIGGGTPGAVLTIALGALAIFGAQRLSARKGPPA